WPPSGGSARPSGRSTGCRCPSQRSRQSWRKGRARPRAALRFGARIAKVAPRISGAGRAGTGHRIRLPGGRGSRQMKVTLERNALLKSLGHVHRVVERRNTYPILANVLLKAADGRIELRATDLDIEVTEAVPAM